VTQREGRGLRQGNENPELEIYTYLTQGDPGNAAEGVAPVGSTDGMIWGIVARKASFIQQVMSNKVGLRSMEDCFDLNVSGATYAAACYGDPRIQRKAELDRDIQNLSSLKSSYENEQYTAKDALSKMASKMHYASNRINGGLKIQQALEANPKGFVFNGGSTDDRNAIADHIAKQVESLKESKGQFEIGRYRGVRLLIYAYGKDWKHYFALVPDGQPAGDVGAWPAVEIGESEVGNMQRIEKMARDMPSFIEDRRTQLGALKDDQETLNKTVGQPFEHEERLRSMLGEADALDADMMPKDNPAAAVEGGVTDDGEPYVSNGTIRKAIEWYPTPADSLEA
jgi:hypothetical protein